MPMDMRYNTSVKYDWDKNKAKSNLSKHGVSFDEAKTAFGDPLYVDFYDPDHSFEEHRFILLGKSIHDRVLFISYAERNDNIRLISAREATPSESRAYEQN